MTDTKEILFIVSDESSIHDGFRRFHWPVLDLDESPWPKSNNHPDSNHLKRKRFSINMKKYQKRN